MSRTFLHTTKPALLKYRPHLSPEADLSPYSFDKVMSTGLYEELGIPKDASQEQGMS